MQISMFVKFTLNQVRKLFVETIPIEYILYWKHLPSNKTDKLFESQVFG